VRARYGPVLASSDDSGVVIMVSRPSALPNWPSRANWELRSFRLGLAAPTGHWGPRGGNSALHTRCVRVMGQCWLLATTPVSVSWFRAPRQCKMGPGEPTVNACASPWFSRTDGALGAKGWNLGFAYTVRARYGPVLTSSDDSGVVVMVSRPSAVPNGPSKACVSPWFGLTDGTLGAKE